MSELSLTQNWLALEHEAIWVYALVGARHRDLEDAARRQESAHRATRDRLSAVVTALGGSPVATQATYDVDDPADADAARALARDVESRICATCVQLVAVTQDDARDRAVRGLRTAALVQVRWAGAPEPFPGLD